MVHSTNRKMRIDLVRVYSILFGMIGDTLHFKILYDNLLFRHRREFGKMRLFRLEANPVTIRVSNLRCRRDSDYYMSLYDASAQ